MLTPSSDAILTRLSKASKKSKSAIIAEFLEDACMPMFERMALVLEAAATATGEAKAAAKQGFQEAEEKLLGVAGLTIDLFDQASRPLLDDAERIKRRSGRGSASAVPAAGASRPPHVTRGSGTPKSSDKTAKSTMAAGSGAGRPGKPVQNRSKGPAKASKPKTKG